MVQIPSMTARDVEAILSRAGFVFQHQTDHRIWRRESHTVPVPAHRSTLKKGTVRSIIKQSGMTIEEFLSYRQ